MYLLSDYPDESTLIGETLDFLIKYLVRRNLTDYPGTRKLDQIFIDTIQECEKYKDSLNSKIIIDFLTQSDKFSSSEEFSQRLNGNIYEINIQAARFILTKIEEATFTDEIWRDLWEKKNNKIVWSIEHILPQGKILNESWVKMIASGDKERAKELQADYTHKLGNLTLTRYNPALSNSDFITKRDKTDRGGKPIGFKNGLFLNKNLAKKDIWTIGDIENRTKYLVKKAKELFEIW